MLGSLIFVVSALLELAFIVLLSRVQKYLEKNVPNETPEKRQNCNAEGLKTISIASKGNLDRKMLESGKEEDQAQNIKNIVSNIPSIHVVDLISFCLYIFFFIFFNVIYWISY